MKEPIALLVEKGEPPPDGELLSPLQHALQTATLARRANASPALMMAALLHDLGKLLPAEPRLQRSDRLTIPSYENGARYLARFFGPDVVSPVRLLPDARRYLARDPDYPDSIPTHLRKELDDAGGPMNSQEAERFRALPFSDAALRLCRWDDLAQDADAETDSIATYIALQHRLRHPAAQTA